MALRRGTRVREKVFIVTGEVEAGYQIDQETGEIQVLVRWVNEDGVTHKTYFKESQLEVITEPAAPAAPARR